MKLYTHNTSKWNIDNNKPFPTASVGPTFQERVFHNSIVTVKPHEMSAESSVAEGSLLHELVRCSLLIWPHEGQMKVLDFLKSAGASEKDIKLFKQSWSKS